MTDALTEKVETAAAWTEYCDLLKKAGDVILRNELDPSLFDKGEGLRYLGRLVRAGLFAFGEDRGPQHPRFGQMPDGVKMGLDNPDNFYLSASIDPKYDYRIRGTRGTVHYMSFAAQNQNFSATKQITGGAGHLNDDELNLGPDGAFEIIASQKEHPGNWLRLAPDTKQILLRQTFLFRDKEKPVSIDIECLDAEGAAPPLDPSSMPGRLMVSAFFAIGCATWFYEWVREFHELAPLNEFHLPDIEKHRVMGGDPNVRMWLGVWKLAPDEALVIDASPPDCDYWNFQLGNIWAESLDFETHNVHINSGAAKYNDDGSFRLIVAHENPGMPNWIETAGHHHGTMALRWVRTDDHPQPKTRVVKLAELR
ncbi:MAG: DUF1214 domain-containing protein [Myxococcota bacterium]